jgi:hypothetical protein
MLHSAVQLPGNAANSLASCPKDCIIFHSTLVQITASMLKCLNVAQVRPGYEGRPGPLDCDPLNWTCSVEGVFNGSQWVLVSLIIAFLVLLLPYLYPALQRGQRWLFNRYRCAHWQSPGHCSEGHHGFTCGRPQVACHSRACVQV